MFVISKLYWILAQPLSLAFTLVLAGVLAGLFGRRKVQSILTGLGLLLLFVTLFTTTGALLLQKLEARFERPRLAGNPACMVILGGGFESEISTARQSFELNEAADRFIEMIHLARLYRDARIIVSGGDGRMTARFDSDGVIAGRMLDAFGIDRARLLIEPLSRNTFENALNSRALLAREHLDNCLLVTSAFHMPRAMGMFRALGVPVVPWPTDYHTDGRSGFAIDLSRPLVNAELMSLAVREWSGLAGNYLAGRTDALFPSP